MSFPPPKNGHYYTERELLLMREAAERGWRTFFMVALPFIGFVGGGVGLVTGCVALGVTFVYSLASRIVWVVAVRSWDDDKAVATIQFGCLAIGLPAALLTQSFTAAGCLLVWGVLLRRVVRAMNRPSARQIADHKARNRRAPRIRE